MNLQEAIQKITYRTARFPGEAFKEVEANPEEVKPYLYEAIDKAICEKENLDKVYQLHFYGLYLLAEFRDKEAFERMIKLVSLPSDTLDYLIGDGMTSGLNTILYLTYNGNLKLLKASIRDREIDEYVRSGMLSVLGQLYLDRTLEEEEWKKFLKELIYRQDQGGYFCAELAGMICRCHFADMMKDMEYLFDEDLADDTVFGNYDSCVDIMFSYSDEESFCDSSLIASDYLKGWAMFEQDERQAAKPGKEELDKMIKQLGKQMKKKPAVKVKIERNDPCPCGSGKKYKQCCLNKPKEEKKEQQAETEEERQKWLSEYPKTGIRREEGKICLEDYFDKESIEIDQMVYLALKHRPGWIWDRESEEVMNNRQRIYLWNAFVRWSGKMEAENVSDLDEYDRKYSIHYRCRRWLGELVELLERHGDMEKYLEVKNSMDQYGCK